LENKKDASASFVWMARLSKATLPGIGSACRQAERTGRSPYPEQMKNR
jgi:hypothetical protein